MQNETQLTSTDTCLMAAGNQRLCNLKFESIEAELIPCLNRCLPDNQKYLRAQIQYILLLINEEDARFIPGALIGLYCALGNSGADLKRRMLFESYKWLSEGMVDLLNHHLETGNWPSDTNFDEIPGTSMMKAIKA